jgi:cytochrome c peroxidase
MSKRLWLGLTTAVVFGAMIASGVAAAGHDNAVLLVSDDETGQLRTLSANGMDLRNPFFQDLGTNGRRCSTCHVPEQAWSFTPEAAQDRFRETRGFDPLFSTNDASNCESAGVATLAERRDAFSLILKRGLIRVGLDVPTQTNDVPPKPAEFEIAAVDDPYHCPASASLPLRSASLYRRPLPSTNLSFLSAIMWDGREPTLVHQANDATLGHAQGAAPLTDRQQNAIVAFETGLTTAQAKDDRAGSLRAEGAKGGPAALSRQTFFVGINDPAGLNPTSAPFSTDVFSIFRTWAAIEDGGPIADARRAIARGEALFNSKPIVISGVAGLNGETFTTPSGPVSVPASFAGSCTVCHDAPNVGDHSVKAPLNIGLADASRRTRDMPLYTLRNLATEETVQTTDPGRAMVTGKWADIGRFKGPILRGLIARAPYFHNGSARTLGDVVDFYDTRFAIGLTGKEKADLVAFLGSL